MSHEIRTPMNAIIGFSSLLQDTLDDSESKSYVDSIINSGKSLLTLINDILDLSKIEAGRLDINYEDFNIEALLHEVVRIFKVKSDEKSIVLDLKLSDKFPKLFRIDGVRLRQILFNIVGNAIKFTEDGSVTIVANFNEDNESLMIEVTDTGICIPENQQEKVFQAFRQQEEQSTRKYGGTGLGLTITKQLTEMMNGNIFVSSIHGKGSTFSVKFNNIEVIDSKKSEITRNKPTSGHFEISKVLIVEDNDLNFKLLKRMISKVSNAEVSWAENGKIGIERFIEFRPDIVLMDVHMPVMDGLESTINIRDLEFGQDVPIIAVTAAAMKEDIEANSLLFEDYLIKPITKNDIIELFSNYFEKIEDDVELVEISSNSDNNEINEDTLNLISRELSKEIEENAKAFDMDLANSLVESINKLSEEKQNSQIKNFASKLAKCIENFDIEGFEEQLKLVS
jgi:CheY-like chemotaxis protein/acylphosphatase